MIMEEGRAGRDLDWSRLGGKRVDFHRRWFGRADGAGHDMDWLGL
jgi:hypothetical protein